MSSDRGTVRQAIRTHAKSETVQPFGNGLAFVLGDDRPIKCEPSQLVEDYGWYIGGIFPNWDARELAVFVFPLENYD